MDVGEVALKDHLVTKTDALYVLAKLVFHNSLTEDGQRILGVERADVFKGIYKQVVVFFCREATCGAYHLTLGGTARKPLLYGVGNHHTLFCDMLGIIVLRAEGLEYDTVGKGIKHLAKELHNAPDLRLLRCVSLGDDRPAP